MSFPRHRRGSAAFVQRIRQNVIPAPSERLGCMASKTSDRFKRTKQNVIPAPSERLGRMTSESGNPLLSAEMNVIPAPFGEARLHDIKNMEQGIPGI
ncbi:hypothetical protein QUF72_12345 [Desulfobacterales bacterium HSG2]|nr:hypothetical protein [Desulfobacterales bacterium HSG2]